MVSVDQLEILLRSVPQYFLFGGLSLYLFGWIDRKPRYSIIAEIIMIAIGISSLIVILSGMIPSPIAEGIVEEHVKMVIKMLILLCLNGLLASISLAIRFIRKKAWKPLVFITFVLSVFLFFSTTKIGKIKFELNVPKVEQIDSIHN